MIRRRAFSKRNSLLILSTVLICCGTWPDSGRRCVCFAAPNLKVEQAGDQFVNFVLREIEKARWRIPAVTRAAELATDRIVKRHGELLSAGDRSFALEPV